MTSQTKTNLLNAARAYAEACTNLTYINVGKGNALVYGGKAPSDSQLRAAIAEVKSTWMAYHDLVLSI